MEFHQILTAAPASCNYGVMPDVRMPQYHELMWPVLVALKELGGSATVKEIYERVVEDEQFSEEQQAAATKDGRMSEIQYRLHWARTHLKGIGAITNSARGVWTILDHGKVITPEQVQIETKAWRAEVQAQKKKRDAEEADPEEQDAEGSGGWKDKLIDRLLILAPSGFCARPPSNRHWGHRTNPDRRRPKSVRSNVSAHWRSGH